MRILCALLLVPVALLGSVDASQTEFNYTSLSVGGSAVSFHDNLPVRRSILPADVVNHTGLRGVTIATSLQARPNLVLGLRGHQLSRQKQGTRIEEQTGALSLGYVAPLRDGTDYVLSGTVIRSAVDLCSRLLCAVLRETGYEAGITLRHRVAGPVELEATVSYRDVGELGSSPALAVGGGYWLTHSGAITANIKSTKSFADFRIGYRYAFW